MSGDEQNELQLPAATYEQLMGIEDDFDQVDLEVIRYKEKLAKDLYTKRQKIIAEIPNFWPLVFEQAPEEFDNVFKPSDLELLVKLKSLSVERFELPEGDPRSISIKWEFEENEYFEDKVLEKRFKHRQSVKGDLSGYVSEPVSIKWKKGKDLTNGLLDLTVKVYEEEKVGKGDEETELKKVLKTQIEDTPMGGLSFFAFFGFRGPRISEEENQEALKKEEEKRQLRKAGKDIPDDDDEMDEDEDDEAFEKAYEYEIYPTADDLAICIAEDMWPDAIKLFLEAQDEDGLSEIDFEEIEDLEKDKNDEDEEMEGTASKKRKA